MRSNKPFLAMLSVTCFLVGCQQGVHTDYSKLGLIDVDGVVTLDGLPIAGAVVRFETPEGTYSYGQTDEAGHYQMMLNSEKSGVLPGPKTVRIKVGSINEDEELEEEGTKRKKGAPNAIPACYHEKSKIEINVDGSQTTYNFDLKSDCSTTGPS